MTDKFIGQCMDLAGEIGCELDLFPEATAKRNAFEDDGTLHIQRGRIRVCFAIGQDVKAKEYNAITRKIMDALGIEVTKRVLTDDSGEEEQE